jgi:Glycosyl transferase family 2
MVAASLMPFTANPPKNGEEETGPQISQIHADSDSKFQTIDNRVNQREPIIDHRSDPRIVPPSGSRSHNLRESAKSADEHHPARITDAAVGDIRLKVSLTIIARDEETILPSCLESVRGLFDEIVVIDTGSHDRTPEIARSFGAKVFDFAWIDDFAAARNDALARATGDYAFWLGADNVVKPPEHDKLRLLLLQLRRGDEAGCVVLCECDPSPDGTCGVTVVDRRRGSTAS